MSSCCQWRIQRGAEGAYAPPPKIAPSMVLKCLKNQEIFYYNSGTIQPTETANHLLESVQHKQYNHNGFVILSQRELVEIWFLLKMRLLTQVISSKCL